MNEKWNKYTKFVRGLASDKCVINNPKLLHGIVGLSTEANELLTDMKSHIFYGKPLDMVHIKEELGDLVWFLAFTIDNAGLSLEEIMDSNVSKLKKRYNGDKFNEEAAINRDLDAERKELEK